MKFTIDRKKMLKHQRAWWDLPNFIKLLVGGYGSGKTYIAALRGIYLSWLYSPLPGQIISPTYNMQHKTILPHLREICTKAEIDYTYKQQLGEFHIHDWDGMFWFGSGDKPDSLRGPNLAWAGIDEPFIQKKEVLEQMLARLRVGEPRELFLTGTPEELNWGYDIAMNDTNMYDVGVVKARTRDNIHLPKDYYETLYSAYTEEMRLAYLDGDFVNLKQGRAYKVFDREKHVIQRDVTGIEIEAGIDFNVDYMSAEIYANGNGWMHFIDEIRLSNSNSFELADKLHLKYPGIKVYPDATGASRKTSSSKSDHNIFRDKGFNVIAKKSNPAVMDRVNAFNRMLIRDLLTIEPNKCPCLVKDLERNVFKSGDLDKMSDPALTHAGDAAGYAIAYKYKIGRVDVGSV